MLIDKLTFDYGTPLYRDFSLDIPDHAITAILGGSGTGKSTLLHLLAGLLTPKGGQVPKVECSYMFQTPRLLPTLTVLGNVQAVLPKGQKDKAKEWLEQAEMGDYLKYYPHELSGGMATRVALARAFAVEKDVLLMDEPFTGLDMALSERLKGVFSSFWQANKPTTLLVTHDPDLALSVCHQVVVLGGKPVETVYLSEVDDSGRDRVLSEVKQALLTL